ncbi:DUF3067 family protein [Leptolyngbya iicbica]|uniref:DUF3067 family protein n=2 Tax=Cyanophyceae TaxID=3028117 RepID=A0A4Q7E1I2_9CYAN|nr:DUF3067 family protein [Leptolyngbya sp. LK]RZM76035.1 DUF3067 family protein [Leptolyngbya sp. LK]
MTGSELHELIISKWGYSFDVQFRRLQDQIFLQVMWRYLEQVSFPLTEAEYLAHLNEVATYLVGWGQADHIRQAINDTRDRPRLGKAVSIPLNLGERSSEWLLDFN